MSFNFKITKKNGKEYGQIVEYFYNNVKKKGQIVVTHEIKGFLTPSQ